MGVHPLQETLPLRLITFNIRYANPRPVPGESPWAERLPRLASQLRFATTGHPAGAFLSLQEALAPQVADVHAALNQPLHPSSSPEQKWSYIGVGRDDGKAAGEFSPVFYRSDLWNCERSQTYWLSETPETPGSRGWDAVLPRIVTMGQFLHRGGTGARVVVLSTHFDHRGLRAREESAKLILRLADAWVREGEAAGGKGRVPVFLGGDFNSRPDDVAYRTMTAPGTGMTDLSTLVPPVARYGHELTYSSFGENGEEPKRIDFLFVRDAKGVRVLTFGVLANRFDDGVFLSDHRATVADVEVPVKGLVPL